MHQLVAFAVALAGVAPYAAGQEVAAALHVAPSSALAAGGAPPHDPPPLDLRRRLRASRRPKIPSEGRTESMWSTTATDPSGRPVGGVPAGAKIPPYNGSIPVLLKLHKVSHHLPKSCGEVRAARSPRSESGSVRRGGARRIFHCKFSGCVCGKPPLSPKS